MPRECRSLTGAVTILRSPPLRRLPLPDTGSHAGAGSRDTRANRKAGVDPLSTSVALVAKLGTRLTVAPRSTGSDSDQSAPCDWNVALCEVAFGASTTSTSGV